jgi:hypothetical protein
MTQLKVPRFAKDAEHMLAQKMAKVEGAGAVDGCCFVVKCSKPNSDKTETNWQNNFLAPPRFLENYGCERGRMITRLFCRIIILHLKPLLLCFLFSHQILKLSQL